ncbi:hypothetical protein [uncultured Shimia sp.]|uniref:hypothetical protein n=1 Tax=uncultured Shimia sp. TaxID=573152 RepID=UPI00261FE5B3|nr:hypothetical protein [uncultured Shimia sp.]
MYKLIKRGVGDARKIMTTKVRVRPALLDADIAQTAGETQYSLDMEEILRKIFQALGKHMIS